MNLLLASRAGMKSDTLNSPQGDGNPLQGDCLCPRCQVRHPQFPARGRKPELIVPSRSGYVLSQTPSIPRKGTETLVMDKMSITTPVVRHPQFPARGRKRDETGIPTRRPLGLSDTLNSPQGDGNPRFPAFCWAACHSQTPSIPRKGTETAIAPRAGTGRIWSDTLNSPQGDGNFISPVDYGFIGLTPCQTPSIPRKGTETQSI